MIRTVGCVCISVVLAGIPGMARSGRGSQDATPLDVGTAIRRDLAARGEEHRYELLLARGEYAEVVVDQQGIDVVVQVRDPDGQLVAEVDDEVRGGAEQAAVVAGSGGAYRVTVKPMRGIVNAGAYEIHVGSRRPATDADRSLAEARSLRTAGARLVEADRYEAAQPLFERALALTERVYGADDLRVARVVAELAAVYTDLPDYQRAQSLYQRAIPIMDTAWGGADPRTAFTRTRLARVFQLSNQVPQAEALLTPALDVLERTLGPQHPWFLRALGTRAALRIDARDFDQAFAILHRQLKGLERIEYTDSVLYAGVLNNLGVAYARTRDFDQAKQFLNRAIAVAEQLPGTADYFLSNPVMNLGIVAREEKDYATSEAAYRRGLAIRERVVGPEHPDLFLILNNLANIYHAKGEYARSLEAHLHALQIGEKAFGPYHQNTLLSVGNIARVATAMGDIPMAIAYQRRADTIIEQQLSLNLAIGSERQKLLFARGTKDRTDRTISLHLREAPDNPEAGALAALAVLQRKGRVLDAMIDTMAAVRFRMADCDDRGLLDDLKSTTAELARLVLSPSPTQTAEQRASAIKELETRKERLEADLALHSAEFRAEMQAVTVEAIQASIPADAALVEFTIFRPYDAKVDRPADAYGPPHYAAYVLRPNGPPRGVDLGGIDAIDEAIDALRQAMRDPKRADVKGRARAVHERIMAPLRSSIGDVEQLLISPDGDLNLVPFEALVDENSRYLIERYATTYLTSGRDLLRMQTNRSSAGPPLIVADPVFGEPRIARAERAPAGQTARRSVTTGANLGNMYFAPLAGTADEGRAIKSLFPEASLITGEHATKTALQNATAPRMLHIASHGFFLEDASANAENPLLRSGLALAGANRSDVSQEEGILTALEASGLNLSGTKLVTLSGCDTGVGEVRNGEGVYGLRRAFLLAGTESVVMSLWPVSDYITREMMIGYYTRLRAGLGRGDALRQAKLAMLKRVSRQHPFYWASFIQSGEWANLDGKR